MIGFGNHFRDLKAVESILDRAGIEVGPLPERVEKLADSEMALLSESAGTLDAVLDEIQEWSARTFHYTPEANLRKLEEEVGEFLAAPSGEEAADVLICLYCWCKKRGVDLVEELRAKFEKNQGRTWEQRPDGSWKHR